MHREDNGAGEGPMLRRLVIAGFAAPAGPADITRTSTSDTGVGAVGGWSMGGVSST